MSRNKYNLNVKLDLRAIQHPHKSNMTFETDVKDAVDKIANKYGVTQANVVNALLRKALTDESHTGQHSGCDTLP